VDDFEFGGNFSTIVTMGRDPFGNIYGAGFSWDHGSNSSALIRKSSDAGATWQTIGIIPNAEYSAIASDPAGNLYATGGGTGGNDSGDFVNRSSDGGATWVNVDSWIGAARHAAADGAGNVYVVGGAGGSWVVRKGIGGVSWSTVDAFKLGGSAFASGVLAHPAGIFVAGTATVIVTNKNGSSTSYPYWYVRQSQDGGNTWQIVDSLLAGTQVGGPHQGGICSDPAGNIYVVGTTQTGGWIVRKSSNGGATWATVDDFQNCVTTVISTKPYRTQTICYAARAQSVAADTMGNVFVCGYTVAPDGSHWIVRKRSGGTGPWQTVDDAGINANPYGAVADDLGHVYIGGHSGSHWIVRRHSVP
jgi:hypothetical protein